MKLESREQRGETVITIHGSFTPSDADELRELLSRLDHGAHVTIDFHEVRSFHDAAVAKLASQTPRAHVALRGLSSHHLRLLEYMHLGRPG